MNLLGNDTILQDAAIALAVHIDRHAGDYPLIEFAPRSEEWLLWEYSKNSILVRFGQNRCELPCSASLAAQGPYIEIEARTVNDAVQLIKLTESIRQRRPDPYIVLGHMPAT